MHSAEGFPRYVDSLGLQGSGSEEGLHVWGYPLVAPYDHNRIRAERSWRSTRISGRVNCHHDPTRQGNHHLRDCHPHPLCPHVDYQRQLAISCWWYGCLCRVLPLWDSSLHRNQEPSSLQRQRSPLHSQQLPTFTRKRQDRGY